MHGDIGRIPIFSFSSCKPLTDILPELPIPKSTHVSIGDKTLLYDSELVLDAFRCINATDDRIVRLLAPAIASVSVDDIEFQDEYSKPSSTTQSPSLLKSLLGKDAFSPHLGYNKENPVIKLKLPPDILVSSNSETYPTKTNVSQGSNNVTIGATGESGFGSYSAICIAPLRISLKKNSNCDSPKAVKLRKPKKHHPTLQGEHKISQDAETDTGGTIEGTNGNQTFQPTCSTEPTSGSDSVTKTPNVHVRPSPTEAPSSENGFTSSGGAFLSIMSNSSSVDVDGSARLRSLCELKQLPGNPPPESDFSRSITPPAASLPSTDPGTLRRVPDPEISQLFHSAALFHAYQPHCEQENVGHCAGGGLFDDWIDSPLKSNVIPQVINPPSSADCAQSLSVSSPSSSAGAVCPSNHIPYSAGVGIDLPLCFSRSPQSVMSNHSSYPTTPGDGLSSVPAVLAGLPASVPSPPLHLKYANIHSTMHPSIRLFDDPKSKTPLLETHVEEQPRIAPHGLAAYLPRSSSLRPQSTNSGHSDIVAEGLRSMSPKSCASPDRAFSGPNSVGTVESSSGPSSTNKGFATAPLSVNASCSRASCDPSPTSRTSFGGRFAGRKVRGGRRRRTEVEELRIWNVNDHAQPEMGPKSGNIAQFSTGVAVDTSRQTEDKGPALVGAVESPLPDCAGPSHSKDFSITESVADHGVFTEALVERVKRRRQQREVGSQRRQTNHSDITSVRSLELSPESTSSPAQPSAICMANTAFFGYGSSHDNRSLLPPVHSIQPKRPHTRSSESDTSSPSNVVFVSSIGPTRSIEFISARSISPLLSTTQKQHTITCTAPSSKPASLGSSIEPSFPISCQSSSCDIDNLMNSTERMTVISSRSHLRVPDLQKSIPSRLDTAFPTQSQGTGGEFNALPNNDVSSLLPTERDPQSNKTLSSYTLSNNQKNRKESPMPPALVPAYAYSPIHCKTGRISGYISHFGTNEPGAFPFLSTVVHLA
ncbi:unnamed protein product [Dicrocoelium dendriticum]|nr:unnamed protein product [Dicrocoelium dendriticum]